MKRHPLDIISLVAGVLFLALGTLFLLDQTDVLSVDARWVPAVVLLALGAGGIAANLRHEPNP